VIGKKKRKKSKETDWIGGFGGWEKREKEGQWGGGPVGSMKSHLSAR
jgi:hypothetical protein